MSASKTCLVLTEPTLAADLALVETNRHLIDLVELRVDCLERIEDREAAAGFIACVDLPVVLTIRREADGGAWRAGEEERAELFRRLLPGGFAFVDFEDDFRRADLLALARAASTRVIRSLHSFSGPVGNVAERARALVGGADEIAKIAFRPKSVVDVADLFRDSRDLELPHVFCAMGPLGVASRILAARTGSLFTYASAPAPGGVTANLGHLSPAVLESVYRFHSITAATRLFAVTGWPLEHTSSPELHNAAYAAAARDAVLVPLPAPTAAEAIDLAEAIGVEGMAVTVPHKETVIPLLNEVEPAAGSVGAVNTVVMRGGRRRGFNTDVRGFSEALLDFLGARDLKGRRVAVIGAGGAARAVVHAIAALGGGACVFNRTLERARDVARPYGFAASSLEFSSRGTFADWADVVVQATSVGLGSDADPAPFFPFTGREEVFDLVYAPAETAFLARARIAGCRAVNGMGMLKAQARAQREIFFEEEEP